MSICICLCNLCVWHCSVCLMEGIVVMLGITLLKITLLMFKFHISTIWTLPDNYIYSYINYLSVRVMVFNTTFNNISVISLRSVLLVDIPVNPPPFRGSLPRKSLISRMDWVSCAGDINLPRTPFPPARSPPYKKIKYNKILTYILRSIFLEIPHLELPRWWKTPRDTNGKGV